MPDPTPLPALLLRHAIAQVEAETTDELADRARNAAAALARHGPDSAPLAPLLAALENACRQRLARISELRDLASADPLTGLGHHRPLANRLATCPMDGTALLAIDVDGFKNVNDTHGHPIGDEVLTALAEALQEAIRPHGELYRVGGDEFVAVVAMPDSGAADKLGRSMCDAAHRVGLTISVGIAIGGPTEAAAAVRHRADAALYAAKRAGRDTVHLASLSA